MTYIEFFDKALIENICASLTNPPERVILIGDKKKTLENNAKRYAEILRSRGFEVEFICRTVNKNKLQDVIDVLSEIIETYDDCVFDLTGGEDIFLVATGIVFERNRDKNLQMHRFNVSNRTIQDCDFDGNTIMEAEMPKITIEENIRVYGGKIVFENEKPGTTPQWALSADFARDIDAMWAVCSEDVRLWNTQIGVFAAAENLTNVAENILTTTVSLSALKAHLNRLNAKYIFNGRIINGLSKAGLIEAQENELEDAFSITYKDAQTKKCLTKAGQALEMKIYISALRCREKDGLHTYNDVMNGVYIDWDGELHTENEAHDTENEIDVMMMHGLVPIFVSCKNGLIEMDELYKLNAVATRFGGKYAKKVLVATALNEDSDFTMSLRARAKEMQIKIVPSGQERLQYMDDAELQKVIKSFWNN